MTDEVPGGNWETNEIPEENLKGVNALAVKFFECDDELAALKVVEKEIKERQNELNKKIDAVLKDAGLSEFRCTKGLLYYRTFNTCKVTDWGLLKKSIGTDVWTKLAKPTAAAVTKWFQKEKELKEEEGLYEYKLEGVIHSEFTQLVKRKK